MVREKGIPASEVVQKLKDSFGDDISIETQARTDGYISQITGEYLWVKVPYGLFTKVVDALFKIDTLHFHIISGFDNGEAVTLRYHFSLFSYAGFNERVPVTLVIDVPKANLVMPSLFGLIPGSEYSERETREMFGLDFDGLPNKALVFLPDKWDEEIKPWRDDEAGLAAHPGSVRRLS